MDLGLLYQRLQQQEQAHESYYISTAREMVNGMTRACLQTFYQMFQDLAQGDQMVRSASPQQSLKARQQGQLAFNSLCKPNGKVS